MDQELVQYLDERFNGLATDLNERFGRIEQRLDGHDRRFDEVNGWIEEVKRHSGVLIEDLRYQVRLVAEGFATFVEGRYAQDQARIDERFNETQALLRTSFEHLARQDNQLRQSQDQLHQRVENLERNQN